MRNSRDQRVHALAIIAHPDDESFLLAGTTFKFAEQGKQTYVLCATRGEKGADRLNRNLAQKDMARVRALELQNACAVLGCRNQCLNYPDGGLTGIDLEMLTAKLARKIELLQPQTILTFGKEGISGHKDHITIGRAAVAAAKKSRHKVDQIWRASMPTSIMKTFNEYLLKIRVHHSHFHPKPLLGVPDNKLLKINIKKFRNKKLAALYCHQSQGLPPWMIHHFPRIRDYFLTCESFEVLRVRT